MPRGRAQARGRFARSRTATAQRDARAGLPRWRRFRRAHGFRGFWGSAAAQTGPMFCIGAQSLRVSRRRARPWERRARPRSVADRTHCGGLSRCACADRACRSSPPRPPPSSRTCPGQRRSISLAALCAG
jgi:hypothetical protein